ncbi:hypothetical protein V2G26_019857 [Clonostachys chloroleuca]
MTTYTVNIQCDDQWVDTCQQSNQKLAMAIFFSDDNGNEVSDIVASTGVVSTSMVAQWQNKYQIAGTTQKFVIGQSLLIPQAPRKSISIVSLSRLESITYKQDYVMPNFGQNYIQANSSLPSDSFGFRNGVTASAIIALPIVGDSQPVSPVYISQFLNPPGYVKIRPIPKAQFWFQNIEARTMIPETQNNAYIVDLSGGSSATISYNSSGGGWTRLN